MLFVEDYLELGLYELAIIAASWFALAVALALSHEKGKPENDNDEKTPRAV